MGKIRSAPAMQLLQIFRPMRHAERILDCYDQWTILVLFVAYWPAWPCSLWLSEHLSHRRSSLGRWRRTNILCHKERSSSAQIFKGFSVKQFDGNLWMFLILSAIFTLGSFSYSFLLLYAVEQGMKAIGCRHSIFSLPWSRRYSRIRSADSPILWAEEPCSFCHSCSGDGHVSLSFFLRAGGEWWSASFSTAYTRGT